MRGAVFARAWAHRPSALVASVCRCVRRLQRGLGTGRSIASIHPFDLHRAILPAGYCSMKRRSERAKFGSFAWVLSVTSIESLAYAIV